MYARNAASPERIAIGQVVLIADGTIQSASVVITVRGQGGAEATGGGTTAYGAENTVYYTPTQAETNFTSFVVIASKASCFSVAQTIITTASATAGEVRLEGVTHTNAVIPSVTLTDTTTTNTDMRGTDSAALDTVATEARLSELDAATAGKMANQVDIIQTDTTTDIPALIADVPTVAEFNARTLLAASYFDPAADTVVTVTNVTNQVTADMTAISGDSVAADNLEATYDGTGYVDDQAPSTQSQLSSISNTGSAVNKAASSYTLTTGTQSSGLYIDTEALDGVRHTHTDTAGAMSLEYHFLIGAGTPSSIQISGYVTGSNDDIDVYGYDWITAGYKQIGNIQGSSSTSNGIHPFDLFVAMVGTGADLGKVDIKLEKASGLSTATLAIDQIFVAYSQGAASTLDAIYYDSNESNTNTVYGTDGIPGNPVSTVAAVNTLLASSGLHKVQSTNDSSATFAASQTNQVWNGEGWTLALGGQDISNTHIYHCNDVSGIGITPTGECHILNSHMGALTIGASHITGGSFGSTFTAGVAGAYNIENAKSGVAGDGVPTFTYSGLAAATTINVRGWMGGGTWVFDADCTASIEVLVGGTHTITTGGGDIEFRGAPKALVLTTSGAGTTNIVVWSGAPISISGTGGTVNVYGMHGGITDTSTGTTVTDLGADVTELPIILGYTAEIGTAGAGLTDLGGMSTGMKAEVNAEADTALTDYDGPTNAEMELRTPTAAQLAYITANASTGVPVTFTTAGGSTTVAVINLVDSSAASATNDQYNGRLLVFKDGTLKDVVTDITDYVGSTTTATITAIPFAPTSSHNARLI